MSHVASLGTVALSLEPVLLGGLVTSAGLYAVGRRRLAARGRGRATPPAWRAACYAAGLTAIGLAAFSPIAAQGERLFSVHMIQHLLLAMVAPPLLWLGAPLVPSLWALPRAVRRRLGRLFARRHPVRRAFGALTHPVTASLVYLSTLALWHVPALYDAAQGPTLLHDAEHALFLATALLYWWPAIYPRGGRRPLGYGATLLYLIPPMLEGDLLGALLSFAQAPLYATYAARRPDDVLAVVADQQQGGLVMWVGGGLFWLLPMAVAFSLASRDGAEAARVGPGRAGSSVA